MSFRYKEIVQKWFSGVFTDGSQQAVDEICDVDMIVYSQGHDEGFKGSNKFKSWLDWYCTSFVDREWFVHDIIEQGDKVVARYSGYSTYKGGLLDIPSEDQRIKETGILILRIEDEKIKELWCEMSDLQVIQQLGLLTGNK